MRGGSNHGKFSRFAEPSKSPSTCWINVSQLILVWSQYIYVLGSLSKCTFCVEMYWNVHKFIEIQCPTIVQHWIAKHNKTPSKKFYFYFYFYFLKQSPSKLRSQNTTRHQINWREGCSPLQIPFAVTIPCVCIGDALRLGEQKLRSFGHRQQVVSCHDSTEASSCSTDKVISASNLVGIYSEMN
jgi:hypothetical protein